MRRRSPRPAAAENFVSSPRYCSPATAVFGAMHWRVCETSPGIACRSGSSTWTDPSHRSGIEQLIGSAAYATLCRPGRWPPLLRSVVHCLDMLDRLDPARSSPVPAIPLLDMVKDSILRTEIRR